MLSETEYRVSNVSTQLLEEARRLLSLRLAILVGAGELIVQCLYSCNLVRAFASDTFVLYCFNHLRQRSSLEELVGPVIERACRKGFGSIVLSRDLIHGLEDIDIIRNAEEISTILVREEVVELVEAAPSDAAETQAARFVCGEEDAVFGIWSSFFGAGEEGLNAVNLAG